MLVVLCKLVFLLVLSVSTRADEDLDNEATEWLNEFDSVATALKHDSMAASQRTYLDNNSENTELMTAAVELREEYFDAAGEKARTFFMSNLDQLSDRNRRLLQYLTLNQKPLNSDDASSLRQVLSNMKTTYNNARICQYEPVNPAPFEGCPLWSYGAIAKSMRESNDRNLLDYVFYWWHEATGTRMKNDFLEYVRLSNKAAQKSGFADYGEQQRYWYVMDDLDFREDLERLWQEILPLYEELHTYVRRYLRKKFPAVNATSQTSTIPANQLGNLWAQDWTNLYLELMPYPARGPIDITGRLLELGYTPQKMLETAEDFYKSMGFEPLPVEFWELSHILKPGESQDKTCHPSAWDLYNGSAAITMCAEVNQEDFGTIFHELGHVYNYLIYKDQPMLFRRAANPGFHEAVGDLMYISAVSPTFLKAHNLLLDEGASTQESVINTLMLKALDLLAFMPFGYLIDQYRWKVYDGTINGTNLNTEFWNMRFKYQGVHHPTGVKTENFDAGGKYHVANDVEYIRYFVSRILMFQFHEGLCRTFDEEIPLHLCTLYNQPEAGKKLRNMMERGSSGSWKKALQSVTGVTEMSAKPFVEYFQPLIDWLKVQNAGDCYGWNYQWSLDANDLPQPRC